MKWNDYVGFGFCESRIESQNNSGVYGVYGVADEPFNALSSLAFVLYGINGLRKTKTNHHVIFCNSLLIFCGIGSILFHLKLCHLFRYFDEIPMILLSSYSAYFFSSSIFGYHKLHCFFWTSYALFLISANVFLDPTIFRILFGIPLAYTMYVLTYIYHVFQEEYNGILTYMCIGLLFWILDMHLCSPIVNIMRLHCFWHLFIGYAAYQLIDIANIISS